MEGRVVKAANSRPSIVLTGPRQTGKTTLLQDAFPKHKFISLDLPTDAELAEKDPLTFIGIHQPPLILDEIQYAPSIFRYLKVVIDGRRDEKGLFLLTGSLKFPLMQDISESLAGRIEILELESLALSEIRQAAPDFTIEEIIVRGGYPELYRDLKLDSIAFYRSYIATYLERDVRNILQVTSLRDFERFMRACAIRSGQLLNKNDLARDIGISPSTANQWLTALQASGQIHLLEPWFNNKSKQFVKSPKLYIADTGILCTLLNIFSVDDLNRSPLRGNIWESLVFAELRKREFARHGGWKIYFYNDRTREVDFVIDRGGQYELLEAKYVERPDDRDQRALKQVSAILGEAAVVRRAIVGRVSRAYPLNDGIQAVPLEDL